MPVCVIPSAHGASPISWRHFSENIHDLRIDQQRPLRRMHSSFGDGCLPPKTFCSNNGFVDSVNQAYSDHHHLIIRPEDVWFSILTQFNEYINAHSEEFRQLFVMHGGKKELSMTYFDCDRLTVDHSVITSSMSHSIQDNIADLEFRDWLMPGFTTTTDDDKIVAAILIMGTLQEFITVSCVIKCGFPSVTLLGEKSDYELILRKLDGLPKYGDEPSQFAALLKPVIKSFMSSFDDPTAQAVIDFWQRTIDADNQRSGREIWTGWITAFCFWDNNGKTLYKFEEPDHDGWARGVRNSYGLFRPHLRLRLDRIRYHAVDSEDAPTGWSKVPLKIVDMPSGEVVDAEFTAGSLGITCSSSGQTLEDGSVPVDSMQPLSVWWIGELVPMTGTLMR